MLTTEGKFDLGQSALQIFMYFYFFYKIVSLGFAVLTCRKRCYHKIVPTKWKRNFIEINKLTPINTFLFIKFITKVLYQIFGINNLITALIKYKESTSGLNKNPNHVGIIIPPKGLSSKTSFNEIIKAASKEISRLHLADVNTITVDDVHGKLQNTC